MGFKFEDEVLDTTYHEDLAKITDKVEIERVEK